MTSHVSVRDGSVQDDQRLDPPARRSGRLATFLAPWWVFAPTVGAVLTALMAVRLFLPGPIGMADNGDGARRMCAADVVAQADRGSTLFFKFVNLTYTHAAPGICNPAQTYPGSGAWLLHLAVPLSHWWGLSGDFDLRALAGLFCLLIGLAATVFAAALRGGLPARSLICLLLFVVVADAAFAGYAASPYSESAGLLGILLATAGATHLGGSVRARAGGLLVFTAGAVLAVAAKAQSVSMVLPFVALLLTVRIPLGRARGAVAGRLPALLAAAVIVTTGVVTTNSQVPEFKEINPTEAVFVGLLGKSPDPAASAVELGLPADFAKYAGRSWWVPQPPQQDPRWPRVRDRMNYPNIAWFLVRNPGIASRIALSALDDFGAARPDYLGSYPVGAQQPPGARESRIAVYSSVVQDVGGGLLLVVLGIGAVGLWWRRGDGDDRRRAFLAAAAALAALALVQFFTAAYGEAIENTKHMVFSIFATGLVFVLAAAAVFCGRGAVAPAGDELPAEGELPPPRGQADGADGADGVEGREGSGGSGGSEESAGGSPSSSSRASRR
ncbi:glycan biosynthesis hexose transferase WsfD [Kitasatospora azatica]|uniref:glycan biosynthesis hexose transferase WsfD n=1 Tax=Kitasatospora azatica TaxID=58347 RepID=UPI00055B12FF|nr:hypothetical protein [Kitasatospora azatica]